MLLRGRRPYGTWLTAIAFAFLVLLAGSSTQASVVERVVAVIEDRAILLSDVRERSQPYLVRIYGELADGAQRAAAISQLHKSLLERMIDEELQQRAANRAQLSVTSNEVDLALERVAAQNNLTVDQVIHEAVRTGLSEVQYREELRRQLLEAKLLNLRIQGRIRITENDLRQAYQRFQREERQQLEYRAAWIVIDAGTASEARRAALALAARLVSEARGPADFGELARRHSVDSATKNNGGLMPRTRPGGLLPKLERAVLSLEVGAVSEPVVAGNQIVIFKLVERAESQLPSYEQAAPELQQRVYLEKMDAARRRWLQALRRRTHIDVRL